MDWCEGFFFKNMWNGALVEEPKSVTISLTKYNMFIITSILLFLV